MRNNYYIWGLLFLLIPITFGLDTIPVTAQQENLLNLVAIGKSIEVLMKTPFDTISNQLAVTGGRKTSVIAENIFTVLFMLETSYTLANQYLEGSIEKIPTTFVVRAFFGSCMIALIHNGLIFGIISDVMTALVQGINNPPNFSWFADGNFNTVISNLTKHGPLSQLDDLFNQLLNTVDVLHIKTLPQFFLIICICCLMTKIYIEGFKIVCGMFIKGIEWCFGLPVAMIFIGMKGSKVTEEYFDIGVRYMYRTALDFTITMLCINIGGEILSNAIKQSSDNGGDLIASLITVFQFLIAFAIWKTLLFGAETLISGISNGSPAFSAAQAAGIISNLAASAKSTASGGLTPFRAGVSGIVSKANGGSFMGGVSKSLGKDVKNYGVGLASSEAWKNNNEGMKKVEKIGEDGQKKQVWATGDASETSGLSHIVKDAKNISTAKKNHINRVKEVNKFEDKHNISEQMMKKMGYHTVAQRDEFMNRHNKLTDMKQDLDDFKVSSKTINSKGKSENRSLFEIEKELAQNKKDFNQLNSMAQINKSANSNLTKQMVNSLNHMNDSDEKVAVLKTWLKSGQNDPLNFSMNKFNENLTKSIDQIKNSNLPENVKEAKISNFKKVILDEMNNAQSQNLKFNTSFEDIKVNDAKSGEKLTYSLSENEMAKIAEENQAT